MKRIIVSLILMQLGIISFSQSKDMHMAFDALLKKHVDEKGMVDYKGLQNDREALKAYLTTLAENPPKDSWTQTEQLAFWINAYNAFTLELVLEYYPVASIKDIGSKFQIPFVNTPWDIKFIQIGDETYDLNNLEHGIIRKDFDEPRIHFALVCAAVSCPKLRNEAYYPDRLDEQLTSAATDFLADPDKNIIEDEKRIKISKLFNWYGGDFTKESDLVSYLSMYTDIPISNKTKIDYLDYDWSLNDQKGM
jgi:hypothetical protein